MKLKSLNCPNCNANLDTEYGLDTFYCKYCGNKILLEGQSKAAYSAKVKIQQMAHEENQQAKRFAHERYKIDSEQKNDRKTFFMLIGGFAILISFFVGTYIYGSINTKQQELKLQAIVDQIMIDIENQNFDEAYVNANLLYWDSSWTSEGKDKWDATRKEILKQIKEAEKNAKKDTNSKDSFWNWFD